MDYTQYGWLLPAWLLGFPLILMIVEKIRTPKSASSNYDAGKYDVEKHDAGKYDAGKNETYIRPQADSSESRTPDGLKKELITARG